MSAHGYGKYTNGCRCEVCRAAKAEYQRKRRAAATELARSAEGRYVADIQSHGTFYGYEERGCRCNPCTEAKTRKRVTEYARQLERERAS